MPWLTAEDIDEVVRYWPQAGTDLEPDELAPLLASARTQCEAYAPALTEGAEVPENYRLAQALQARALFRSGIAGSNDQIGAEGYTVTVFPMDWTVKNLLRPKKGRLSVR